MTVANKEEKVFLNNTYSYDKVNNILSVVNAIDKEKALNVEIGGTTSHTYTYDDWHRLKTATGNFNSFDGSKTANYHLEMGYDNLYNITSKKLTMSQTNLQFDGTLSAGHEFSYTYGDENPMQLASVETKQYNVDGTLQEDKIDSELQKTQRTQNYEFDANGNMTSVSVDTVAPIKSFLWDEENRLLAVNNNGSVSCYFYDAAGERTVKLTSESEMVHVNGKKVGGNANISKFTAYVSPYFVVSNGGAYTKHIYAASQRIASKLGNEDGFGADPRRVEMAGGKKISDFQKGNVGERFKALGYEYSAPEKEKVEKDSTMDSESEEKLIFFYHPDHLGSTSYVTDADGNIAQHVEYIPYGEVFVEERNSQFSTNYLFNAKELDNETGLYYYGARYLDPTGAMWLSVDPLFEKYAGMSPYNYCAGNPVKLVDPTGREVEDVEDLIKTFERVNGELTTCAEPKHLEDNYSYVKDYVDRQIPVGKNYRNSYTGRGGCAHAVLCSILDMFCIDRNSYDRAELDDSRITPDLDANVKVEFTKLRINNLLSCNVIRDITNFDELVRDMKEDEAVYAMLFKSKGNNNEITNHNVVVTGISKDGKIQFWDNATRRYNSTSSENIIEVYQFFGNINPWKSNAQININYDPNKYLFK